MTNNKLTDFRDLSQPVDPQVAEYEKIMETESVVSKEQLQHLLKHSDRYPMIVSKIARRLLTAEAELQEYRKAAGEPVAWLVGDVILFNPDTVEAYAKRSGLPVQPLYTIPQPAPAVEAVPDGYALVPIEPTENMIIQGFESELDENFSEPRVLEEYQAMSGCQQAAHRVRLCWAAMIAAAPRQEVK